MHGSRRFTLETRNHDCRFSRGPGIFYRSIALERDAKDPSAGRSFVLTPWLQRGAKEILDGLSGNSTRRAWRIIGDFGVGKSALALAMVQALDPRLSDDGMALSQMRRRHRACIRCL